MDKTYNGITVVYQKLSTVMQMGKGNSTML
jgi:hypothetical protein